MKRLAAPAALALAAVLLPAVSLPGTALAQDGSAAANAAPALARLDADDALIVLVDFTSGLYPIVDTIDVDEMLNNAVALAKIAETFDIPVMVLGDEGGFYGQMHPAIKAFAGPDQPFERTTPSAWASGGFRAAVEATGRKTVLIGGITTDNCTLLTSLDLLRAGYDVRVVTDISGADSEHSERAALNRLRDAGAVTTGWISVGSELIDDWRTPEGEAVTMIYGRHMNGPNTSAYGGSQNDARIGAPEGES